MYRGKSIAIVVPAYNEEMLIGRTLETMPDYVDRIFVVNDGSTDATATVVEEHVITDNRVVLINKENGGVGSAIIEGYKAAIVYDMDISAVMAGDHQMDPEHLPTLLDPIVDGEADYTKGNRLYGNGSSDGMSRWRFFGNNLLTFFTKLSSGQWHINDPQNGYTAIDNRVFLKLDPNEIFPWYGYCNDMLTRMKMYGFRVRDVPIPARYGEEKSKIKYPEYMYKISSLLLIEFMMRITYKQREMGVIKFISACFVTMVSSYLGILLALEFANAEIVPFQLLFYIFFGLLLTVSVLFSFYLVLLILGTLFLGVEAPRIRL